MKSRLKDNFALAVHWQSGTESRNCLSVLTVIKLMEPVPQNDLLDNWAVKSAGVECRYHYRDSRLSEQNVSHVLS